MVMSPHGKTEYIDNKKKLSRYNFFHDEKFGGRDAIYGLDIPLMKLVNGVFKRARPRATLHREARPSSATWSERGPPSRSRSARRLQEGHPRSTPRPARERSTPSAWHIEREGKKEVQPCPMNEEPLHLIPVDWRKRVFAELVPTNPKDGSNPLEHIQGGPLSLPPLHLQG